MDKLIICVLLLVTTLHGKNEVLTTEVNLDWFDYPTLRAPYRMSDLDGATIAMLSLKPTAVPLFFPRLVSPFEWIDSGNPNFISLDDLCENPHLHPPIKQYKQIRRSPFAVKKNIWDDSIAEDSPIEKKTDKFNIQRLIGSGAKSLPNEKQLLSFLQQDKVVLSYEEKQKILENLFSEDEQKDFISRLLKPNVSIGVGESSGIIPSDSSFEKPKVVELTVPKIEIPEAPAFSFSADSAPVAPGKAVLKFKVSKSSEAGGELPAQASDFYVTSKNLADLFNDLGAEQAIAGEVRSVAELWARAEKSSDPEVIFGIKSILLQAKVGKTRTDAFGQAALSDIQPSDKYFLIGIENDDLSNQVTIWSKEIQVNPGENMIELTANDVIYQE